MHGGLSLPGWELLLVLGAANLVLSWVCVQLRPVLHAIALPVVHVLLYAPS